jgi:hypothetical protein
MKTATKRFESLSPRMQAEVIDLGMMAMGKLFNVGQATVTVRRRVKDNDGETKKVNTRPFAGITKSQFAAAVKKSTSTAEMAKHYGVAIQTVYDKAYKLGVSLRRPKAKKTLTAKEFSSAVGA